MDTRPRRSGPRARWAAILLLAAALAPFGPWDPSAAAQAGPAHHRLSATMPTFTTGAPPSASTADGPGSSTGERLDPPRPTASPAPLQTDAPFAGQWAGGTSQGLPISFDVLSNQLPRLEWRWRSWPDCPTRDNTTTLTHGPPITDDASFGWVDGPTLVGAGLYVTHVVGGTFISPTTASGQITTSFTGPASWSCQVVILTWKARRQ